MLIVQQSCLKGLVFVGGVVFFKDETKLAKELLRYFTGVYTYLLENFDLSSVNFEGVSAGTGIAFIGFTIFMQIMK